MSIVPRFFSGVSLAEILAVSAIDAIGPIAWQKIITNYQTLKKALTDSGRKALTDGQAAALRSRKDNQDEAVRQLRKHNIGVVLLGQKNYPTILAEIPDPPLWLFYRGQLDVLQRPTVSIVGSRKSSSYGLSAVEILFPNQLLSQLTTVSGLAYGIDKKIHEQSLKANSSTVAVLAGGLDAIYPVSHTRLAEDIIKNGGLLLSEYPPLSKPKGYRFPIRNRIIAGLSAATVVIEAAIKSGSLTTAKSAVDYNRDLFAVPGDITRMSASGVNLLIQHGATALTSSTQLFDYFGFKQSTLIEESLDSELRHVLELLARDPKNIEQIAVEINQPIEVALGLVTQLELLCRVYQPKPGYYLCK